MPAPDHRVFVFGSNLAGRHGKGAALFAKRYRGAIQGRPSGLQGQSYAIPTKNRSLQTLSPDTIYIGVLKFYIFALNNPDLQFQVTPIGCGLAGYKPEDIAWMFADPPENVDLPIEFTSLLG